MSKIKPTLHKPKKYHWWYRWIRSISWFSFRYYWFVWILFLGSLIPLIWCLNNRIETKQCKSIAPQIIENIHKELATCCACHADTMPTRKNPKDSVAVDCPDRILAFQVCNSNRVKDDNFEVYLNGTKIGELDLNSNDLVGSVFLATTNQAIKIKNADFICPVSKVKTYYFDPSIVNYGKNTIYLKNVKRNNNGNEGTIEIRNYLLEGNFLSSPCKVKNLTYTGATGAEFKKVFHYTRCCE